MKEISLIEEIFTYLVNFDFNQNIFESPVFINILSTALFSLSVYFFVIFVSKKAKVQNIDQTYICINTSCVICGEGSYKVNEIPDVLMEYRRKLYSHEDDQNFMMWNTRVSTFLAFTDGQSILLFDRDKATQHVPFKDLLADIYKYIVLGDYEKIPPLIEVYKKSPKKMIINNRLDCYGAIEFHNPSLKYKLPSVFLESEIEKIEPIPGIALEKNVKKLLKLPIFKTKNTAVMIGFIIKLSTEELLKGEDERNTLYSIHCLSSENNNLTSKAKLSIRHIKTPV